jgi:hypothetical protein
VLADELADVEAQPFRQLRLEREGLGEVEAGLQEQDRDVRADLDRHVHHARPLGLEGRGDRDALQPRVLERPTDDLARVRGLEPVVERVDLALGQEGGLGHGASRVGGPEV